LIRAVKKGFGEKHGPINREESPSFRDKGLEEIQQERPPHSGHPSTRVRIQGGPGEPGLKLAIGQGLCGRKGANPKVVYEFTDFGRAQVKSGTVEEQILSALINNGPKTLPELAALLQLENKDIGSAFGLLSKEGLLAMGEGKRAEVKNSEPSPRMLLIKELMTKAAESGELEGNSLKDEDEKRFWPASVKNEGPVVARFA
jgi:hypothetical protein